MKKNNTNEIDIVAVNDLKKKIVIADVKWDKRKRDLEILKSKSEKWLLSYPDFQVEWKGLSLENVKDFEIF